MPKLLLIFWSFINPIFTTIVITFVFKKVGKVYTAGYPHILFTLVGMIGWTYMANVIQMAGGAMVGAQDLVKKIYFPRLYIPFSKAVAALVTLLIMFLCLGVTMLYYGVAPQSTIIYLPLFIIMAIVTALGIAIWVSALTIRFRDLIHTIPIFLRIGMFISPIAYSAKQINGWNGWIKIFYYCNPLTGVIESIRWSILGIGRLHEYTYLSFGIGILLLITGLRYFFHVERTIADLV